MGSLTSRPQVVPPQPTFTPPPPPDPVTPDPVDSDTTDPAAEAEQTAEQRRQNLLRRGRGRQGTVLTSFRGLLSQFTDPSQRKTLLGE